MPAPRRAFNVLVTFLVSGLWHGAAWQFVLWGGINGGAVVGTELAKRNSPGRKATPGEIPGGEGLLPSPQTLLRMLLTFGIVCLAWVFFRAQSMSDALLILQRIALDAFSSPGYAALVTLIDDNKFVRKSLIVLLVFVLIEWVQRRRDCPLESGGYPLPVRWAAYTFLIWITLDLTPQSGGQEFIYFDF
jgi:D-alanyl-lipoteichoic acid acyltransferase DltB (MBOAT superfamily)